MHLNLFKCRLSIFAGQADEAQTFAEQARTVDPAEFPVAATRLLAPESFELHFPAGNGNVQFALARVFRLFDLRQALERIDRALSLELRDGTDYPNAPA